MYPKTCEKLRVIFDENLNVNEQVNEFFKKQFYQLNRPNQLKKYLYLKSLIHSFVASHNDIYTIYYITIYQIIQYKKFKEFKFFHRV